MRIFAISMIGLLFMFGLGCHSENVKGTGTVKYSSGEPVPGGTVLFVTEKNQFTGEIVNGSFTLGGVRPGDGLPPGNYKVGITGRDASDKPYVAAKYANANSSGISYEVKDKGSNVFDITVEKP